MLTKVFKFFKIKLERESQEETNASRTRNIDKEVVQIGEGRKRGKDCIKEEMKSASALKTS